jgi:hypothetical protein
MKDSYYINESQLVESNVENSFEQDVTLTAEAINHLNHEC